MRTRGVFIIILAAVIGLTSCSSQESALVKNAEVNQNPVLPKRQPQVSPLRRKVLYLLEKKNYRQALDLMNGKNHEGLEREYIQALNGLLEVGEGAFSLGDYEAAARAFKRGLSAYPVEPALREKVSHDPKRIKSLLKICVNRLMDQGLEEYRRGRLESAIRKWKELLTISPGHHEAKKAINTATVQLQSLQDMNNK